MKDWLEDCFKVPTNNEPSGFVVYIAGPITNDLVGNIPEFFAAEDRLRQAGHVTFNPARIGGGRCGKSAVDAALHARQHQRYKDWVWYMKRGLQGLMACDSIAVLPNWYWSQGARTEHSLAASLGYAIIDSDTGALVRMPPRPTGRLPEEFATA